MAYSGAALLDRFRGSARAVLPGLIRVTMCEINRVGGRIYLQAAISWAAWPSSLEPAGRVVASAA